MKKVFRGILILIYSLLFFVVLNIFSENDRHNIYSNFGFNEQYDNVSMYFEEPLSNDQKVEVIKRVDRLAEMQDVAITVSNYITEDDMITGRQVYVAAQNNFVSEMLPNNIKLDQDFYRGHSYISNTETEDDHKINLFTFYKGLTYEMYPFHFLEDDLDIMQYNINIYFDSNDRATIEKLIDEEFSDINTSLQTMSADIFNRNEELEKSVQSISIIAVVIFILFILFTISYNIKDIAILKLNGFKVRDILIDTFKSDLLYSVLLAILIPLILSLLVFQTVSSRLIEFNAINISVGFLLVAIFIGLIILSTLVISQYRLSDFIKNKNMNSILTKMTYGLLVLTTIVILPMVNEPINKLIETVQIYIEVKLNERNIDHIHAIQFNQENRNWEFDQFAYLSNEPNEKNQRQITIYDDLAEMDAIYHVRPTVISPQSVDFEELSDYQYAGYHVNGKYIEESDFLMNGEKVKIEDKHHLNILMDISTFESYAWQKNDFTYNEIDATIYIFDNSDYLKLEHNRNEGYLNEEAPIFLYTENENLFVKNLSDGGFYIDDRKMTEINEYLSSENLENEMAFYKLNNRSSVYTEGLFITLQETSIQILPGLISLLAVFISFTNFHSLEKNREIKILKSLGYKPLTISKNYIIEIVILNAIFIGYSFVATENVNWKLVLYLFGLSVLMVSVYLTKIRQAKIKSI